MNDWGTWRLIKAGFWLGVGFILPSLVVYALGTYGVFALSPVLTEVAADGMGDTTTEQIASFRDQYDQTNSVEIVNYLEKMQNGRLVVNGVVRNDGQVEISSIQLEAELFDANGEFVLECSEYVSQKLKPEETENFQIKCGCRGDTTPAYENLTVRVVSANSY